MGQLSTQKRKCIVEQFTLTKSTVSTRRAFRKSYGFRPSRKTVEKFIDEWNTKAAIQNLNKNLSGRSRLAQVYSLVRNQEPSSVRKIVFISELGYPTVHRILRKNHHMHPYHIILICGACFVLSLIYCMNI